MNKKDIQGHQLQIGSVVVLVDCYEAVTRKFEFWKVTDDGPSKCVRIIGLSSGKTDCFSADRLKIVNNAFDCQLTAEEIDFLLCDDDEHSNYEKLSEKDKNKYVDVIFAKLRRQKELLEEV